MFIRVLQSQCILITRPPNPKAVIYFHCWFYAAHYCDVMMGTMASQITSIATVYSTIHSGADQRKHQSSASLAVVRGIHRWPMNSPHKWPVTRRFFPFGDIIMSLLIPVPNAAIVNIEMWMYGEDAWAWVDISRFGQSTQPMQILNTYCTGHSGI